MTQNEVQVGNFLDGVDTETTIGNFTNDDLITTRGYEIGTLPSNFTIVPGTQVDLADFGGGFENEWIDVPANGSDPGVSDLFITPFGDFPLMGTFFADLSAVIP